MGGGGSDRGNTLVVGGADRGVGGGRGEALTRWCAK